MSGTAIWPIVINACSGLGGVALGGVIARRGERETRAEEQLQRQRESLAAVREAAREFDTFSSQRVPMYVPEEDPANPLRVPDRLWQADRDSLMDDWQRVIRKLAISISVARLNTGSRHLEVLLADLASGLEGVRGAIWNDLGTAMTKINSEGGRDLVGRASRDVRSRLACLRTRRANVEAFGLSYLAPRSRSGKRWHRTRADEATDQSIEV